MSVKIIISLNTVIKSNFHNQSEADPNHPELAQTNLERRKENLLGLVVNTAHGSQSIHSEWLVDYCHYCHFLTSCVPDRYL